MADIYRVYNAYSIDGGDTFGSQEEVYPGAGGTLDYDRTSNMHQEINGVYYGDRKMFVIWTQDGGGVQCAIADLPSLLPKINKLNRKRAFGNEL